MTQMRILVCDDEELITDLLRFRLEARGYAVTVAADGGEAIAQVESPETRPDLVVLDAMMPVIEGYEVLRRIRANESTRKLPVIMLTARKREADVLDALKLGADDFIVKPFIPEEIIARIARLLHVRL